MNTPYPASPNEQPDPQHHQSGEHPPLQPIHPPLPSEPVHAPLPGEPAVPPAGNSKERAPALR